MVFKILLCIVVLVALSFGSGQQPEQQTVQLTREMVDALLQVLSPVCKLEMEAALGSQGEISDECKYEIQRTMASFQNNGFDAPVDPAEGSFAEDTFEPPKPKKAAASASNTPPGGVSPVVYIVGFVVAFFAAIGGLIVFVNKQRANGIPLKPKKLSKKKVINVCGKATSMCMIIGILTYIFMFVPFFYYIRRRSSGRRARPLKAVEADVIN